MSGIIGRIKAVYRITRDYGRLKDSPRERLRALFAHLFSSRELPNIILGGALSFSISASVGSAPWGAAALAWLAWVLALVNYVVAEEIIHAYAAYKEEFHDDDPPGIY